MGEEEKKSEEGKKEVELKAEENSKDKVKSEEPKAAEQPLPPPQEIILKVYMHCEGCARKVRRCLKDFEGVEDVITDCRSSKVVVKGEKADPLKVLERVQKKSHRQVELISPIPKPPPEDNKLKPEEVTEVAKSEEKKTEEEPPVVTVLLGVYMHCEACAQEIKKRIQRMKGVESAEPDLKSSQVTVKGVFEPEKLVDHVWKRTGKHAVISKVEPEMKPEEEGKGGEKVMKVEEREKETKKVEKDEEKEEKNGGVAGNSPPGAEPGAGEPEDSKMEFKRNEIFFQNYPQNHEVYYPQRFTQDHSYVAYPAPQIFSDENPNACFVM
ncbi:heavy metal-associated isoprenylated plant protein 7-like [Henckelia pumila]|uniref:heavy metal-associated isoprenylated plant protein 7-like n=1 Tax=Henckelia pumila TaxID=405737 RepID=UPI003C6E173F